jgi:hypothetical protein
MPEPEIAKAKIYVGTSVIIYLNAWPSRDIVIAGQQQTINRIGRYSARSRLSWGKLEFEVL